MCICGLWKTDGKRKGHKCWLVSREGPASSAAALSDNERVDRRRNGAMTPSSIRHQVRRFRRVASTMCSRSRRHQNERPGGLFSSNRRISPFHLRFCVGITAAHFPSPARSPSALVVPQKRRSKCRINSPCSRSDWARGECDARFIPLYREIFPVSGY